MINTEIVNLWFEKIDVTECDEDLKGYFRLSGVTVHELVEVLGVSKTSVHQLINTFNDDMNAPNAPTEFPNAFKAQSAGKTSPVVIPLADVVGYMARRLYGKNAPLRKTYGWVNVFADLTVDEVKTAVAVWQEDSYGVAETCRLLDIGKTKLYEMLTAGEFPHAYKPLGTTSRFRIPQRDIDAMGAKNG